MYQFRIMRLTPLYRRVVAGEANVLWPGKPLYFAKTSGTTSGTKYILDQRINAHHIEAAKMHFFVILRQQEMPLCRWKNDFYKEVNPRAKKWNCIGAFQELLHIMYRNNSKKTAYPQGKQTA